MSDFLKIKYEVEELKETILNIANKIPQRITEMWKAENNTVNQTINFTVKNFVNLEVIIMGNSVSELKIYHNNIAVADTSGRIFVANLNCVGERKHSLHIEIKGVGLESCYVCLSAPKIKKI